MIPQVLVAVTPPSLAQDMRDRLRQCGCVVQLVSTTEAAVRRTTELIPQLVFLDLSLPGQVEAIAAAATIRERSRIPVVLVVDSVDEMLLEQTDPARPAGFVCKPCNQNELQSALAMTLHRHRRDAAESTRTQRFAQLIGQMDVGILATDVAGNVAYLNPAAEALTGWPADQAVGIDYLKVLQTLDPKSRLAAELVPSRGAEVSSGQFFLLRQRDGTVVPVLMSLSCLSKAGGRMDGLVFSVRPFNSSDDRDAVQAELTELRALADLPAGVFLLDADGHLRWSSPTLVKLAGLTPSTELKGQRLFGDVLVAPDGLPAAVRAVLAGQSQRADLSVSVPRSNGEPTRLRLLLSATSVVSAGVAAAGLVLPVVSDDAPDRLTQLDALQRTFGQVARHLNNAAVLSRGECRRLQVRLKELLPEHYTLLEQVESLQHWLDRDAGMLAAMGNFAGWQAFHPTAVRLNELLVETADHWRRLLGTGRPLSLEVSPETPPVLADSPMLRKILTLLVENARDAMPNGGTVLIRVRETHVKRSSPGVLPLLRSGPFVTMDVTDTGVGMTPEVQSRLFEPLMTTKATNHFGLGLAEVYGAMDQIDGGVEVQSAVGRGTTVRLYLPLAAAGSAGRATSQPSIMVFAEDRQSRENLVSWLRDDGYQVVKAGHLGDLLLHSAVHGQQLRVLIAELGLHQTGFREAVTEVQRLQPLVKLLCLSQQPRDVLLYAGLVSGEWRYLSQPTTREGLLQAVKSLDVATASPSGLVRPIRSDALSD